MSSKKLFATDFDGTLSQYPHGVTEEYLAKITEFRNKGNVFGIEPPFFVELAITSTEPGVKGNTATNATKPAVVETGAEIRVPLFINEGDRIRIDTRTREYMERA